MPRVRVKICGVRSLEEAALAVSLGADALGFNFWNGSKRYIAPAAAREIIKNLRSPFFNTAGVFVNETDSAILEISRDLGLSAVQLHGDESVEYCKRLGEKLAGRVKIVKAIRVGEEFDPAAIAAYPASAILLDSNVHASYGGTGKKFDWSRAIKAKAYAPIILAGGITASNVDEAISTVQPLAIDVCSGVEAKPGLKDPDKMRDFMAAVDRANAARH